MRTAWGLSWTQHRKQRTFFKDSGIDVESEKKQRTDQKDIRCGTVKTEKRLLSNSNGDMLETPIAFIENIPDFVKSVLDQYDQNNKHTMAQFHPTRYGLKWEEITAEEALVCWLVGWYFEPSQPQRVTSWLKTMFNLSSIYSARKSPNHKLSINHKISHDTNWHKTKHTQTSDTKLSKN